MMRGLFFKLVVMTVVAVNQCSGKRYHVDITNNLSPNNVLNLHCRSKDDDLGKHALAVGGDFSFSFQVSLFGTTTFWCDVNWGNIDRGSYVVFTRDYGLWESCDYKNCFWSARDDGLYLMDIPHGRRYKLVYSWSSMS
ncbi:S-protein homolog 21-like [Carica papaya]|uniref:S-protein homolog 21-like n=1 Tax=Carica papaya TaxID=3649 RepID=UPI000B8CCA24|nr:S-protein homolog 21-like [Carica papaya]